MNTNQEFEDLFAKLANGSITKPELSRLLILLDTQNLDNDLIQKIKLELKQPTLLEDTERVKDIASKARNNIMARTSPTIKGKSRSIYRPAVWWAASLILVGGLAIQYFKTTNQNTPATTNQQATVQDIAPGGNNAVLTLSNGETIVLDSTQQQLVSQEGALKYDGGKNVLSLEDSVYNLTLATPRKCQYQVLLPDGTHVWLNAESKISYPSRFDDNNRTVSVEGEVYFEVAKRQGSKFIVQLGNGHQVEVLGTHFNINSYSDFPSIKTTLLEGSVKVVSTDKTTVTLKPNEQATQRKNRSTITVGTVNTDNIIAWKNNKFNFEGLRFEEIMSQIERWYDVKVEYQNEVPDIEFYGEIGRQNSLLYVLKVFENSGVKLQLKGNKLLVY
ncbi:FecR family protein [Sphingobacterium faecale]|uniref:FecR family protein n=1 Tax=Sphingobacterium faecale TaxID=2803775 RepID=A0ABS1R6P4_9SPHI|nr:FecR family protein [Sphingobacterium faecale]MBL1410363.1 FecR family protein [Sphingobacterium faecale]